MTSDRDRRRHTEVGVLRRLDFLLIEPEETCQQCFASGTQLRSVGRDVTEGRQNHHRRDFRGNDDGPLGECCEPLEELQPLRSVLRIDDADGESRQEQMMLFAVAIDRPQQIRYARLNDGRHVDRTKTIESDQAVQRRVRPVREEYVIAENRPQRGTSLHPDRFIDVEQKDFLRDEPRGATHDYGIAEDHQQQVDAVAKQPLQTGVLAVRRHLRNTRANIGIGDTGELFFSRDVRGRRLRVACIISAQRERQHPRNHRLQNHLGMFRNAGRIRFV